MVFEEVTAGNAWTCDSAVLGEIVCVGVGPVDSREDKPTDEATTLGLGGVNFCGPENVLEEVKTDLSCKDDAGTKAAEFASVAAAVLTKDRKTSSCTG